MFAALLRVYARALRRAGVLSPTGAAYAVPPSAASTGEELSDRPTLDELVAAAPDMRPVLLGRARDSGLLTGAVSVLVVPAWTFVDRVVSPDEAHLFLLVRVLCDVPIVLLTLALAILPLGRRRPELLTYGILAVVQAEVAWMLPRSAAPHYYVMGLTLAIWASGCMLVIRPRFTTGLIVTTWAALAVFVLAPGPRIHAQDLAISIGYVGTASLISVLAHLRRHRTTVSELSARLRLEHEQARTRLLLGRLDRLSHEDPLTGLANRRRWDAELVAVCTEARERSGTVSVLLLDLDHFKRVNDEHGHPAGDEVLRRVAGLLSGGVRGDDLVARLGGDEFGVLLPGAVHDRAAALAEDVRCAASALLIDGFEPGEVSLSVGVATSSGADAYPMELMACADEQLYRAKITRNAVGVRAPAP